MGEECDGVNLSQTSCIDLGFHGGALSCDDTCRFILTGCEEIGQCGDNVIQEQFEECEPETSHETCNDLHLGEGVAICTSDCQWDLTGCSATALCGDDEIEGNEDCEGENLNGSSCVALGFHGGTLECNPETCRFDRTSCETFGRCGDDVIQESYGEECEGDEYGGASCESLGFDGGTLRCTGECTFDTTLCEYCGDGVRQETSAEQCDGSDFGDASCATSGGYRGALACTSLCEIDISGCERCGDGVAQTADGESCDGSDLSGETCESQGHTYGGALGCNSDCSFNLSACSGYCGDDYADETNLELCDGSDLAGMSCTMGGTLACDTTCDGVITTGCHTLTAISAGERVTCGINTQGEAFCWGKNNKGQLGNGTTIDSLLPTPVHGSHSFNAISAGYGHVCAVDSGDTAWCWGNNNYGQLGDGTTTQSSTPVQVSGGQQVAQISTGDFLMNFTCARSNDMNSQPYCWGYNDNGQLGDGTQIKRSTPAAVSSLSWVDSITTGYMHACGCEGSWNCYCWGYNNFGQLGDGTTDMSLTPSHIVDSYLGFTSLEAGGNHTCALTADGTAYCWGQNTSGELGDGTTTTRVTPTPVAGGHSFTTISSGANYTCAIATSSELYCWGHNSGGQLGDGTIINKSTPTLVLGGLLFSAVTTGNFHTCALTTSGRPYCWGLNDNGELGDGTTTSRTTPTPVREFQ